MAEYPIRPAARMITTIGKDLIKDMSGAIVELVKNAFDADAEEVEIKFTKYAEGFNNNIMIEIKDNGHGMDLDTIINSWLVPATPNKLNKVHSLKKNRTLQGRKGIGRYAVAILGDYLQLETIHNKQKTVVYINWDDFEKNMYLEDVRVEVETIFVDEPNGTLLRVIGNEEFYKLWNEKELKKMEKELRKLVSPFQIDSNDDPFIIRFKTINFFDQETTYSNYETTIEPLPIMEMYNYRLHGTIKDNGEMNLIYENNSMSVKQIEKIESEVINLEPDQEKYCGQIELDIRVFDLDTESIDSLNQKLSNILDLNFNRREVTKNLKELTGIGIYRGGFRIRPHGDKGYDWLGLDSRRVQNPSLRIGVDQVIGFISIESEDISKLEEKSSRDGLKENAYFLGLIKQVLAAIRELEDRRFAFRRSVDGSKKKTVYEKMEDLFNFSNLQSEINKDIEKKFDEVSRGKDKDIAMQEFLHSFNSNLNSIRKEKQKEYEEIKQIIALYQGQATLGSITTVVLHEGRKHTSWFSNTLPRILNWLKEFKTTRDEERLDLALTRLENAEHETASLVGLFDKLDPLTITKKGQIKNINISKIIDYVENVFKTEIDEYKIKVIKEIDKESTYWIGLESDLRIVLTNLMENSIYWLKTERSNDQKFIKFLSYRDEHKLIIEIMDNGPGIKKQHIENESIFNPGFSAKEAGTGLGLSISGEALKRNKGKLKALYSEDGAHFRIELEVDVDE